MLGFWHFKNKSPLGLINWTLFTFVFTIVHPPPPSTKTKHIRKERIEYRWSLHGWRRVLEGGCERRKGKPPPRNFYVSGKRIAIQNYVMFFKSFHLLYVCMSVSRYMLGKYSRISNKGSHSSRTIAIAIAITITTIGPPQASVLPFIVTLPFIMCTAVNFSLDSLCMCVCVLVVQTKQVEFNLLK